MRSFLSIACFIATSAAVILQNGQVRETDYPNTTIASIASNSSGWTTYGPNATEITYKGRWDDRHISWWSAPGLKFGFSGSKVALSFGQYTSPGVLIAYRLSGLDWMFTNVTANSTHQLISPSTPGMNLTAPGQLPNTLEVRVTNWAYGIQISGIHVSSSSRLIKLPAHSKTIEFIGDSLSAGAYATYEGLSSFTWGIGAGFGNVEFSITARPGICLVDINCWGNPRGQIYQWYHTSDTSGRAIEIYGENPPTWNFNVHPAADIVIINIGTNDFSNNVTNQQYLSTYVDLVAGVHKVYPDAQVILMSLWGQFNAIGNTYVQAGTFIDEIWQVYKHYKDQGFVHYFNTTGILQHNDIGPQYHPTDVGHVKIASHVMQYIHQNFGWEFAATGPEVQHDTLYWNDEQYY